MSFPLILITLSTILVTTILNTTYNPSSIEQLKIEKVENKIINNQKFLFEAIQRYVILENSIPTIDNLVDKGYFDINNYQNGFNDSFNFIIEPEFGIVKIQTKISDPKALDTFLNSTKNTYKPKLINEEEGLVETSFVLQKEISHNFGQFLSGIPIQSQAPHPSETKYWYDTNGSEVVLRTYDETKGGWVASNVNGASELITQENVALSKEDLNLVSNPEIGDVKYAYDSETNVIQEFVYLENMGWTMKGSGSNQTKHYTDNPYLDKQAIKLGLTIKDNKELVLCNNNKHWCLKSNLSQVVDGNGVNNTKENIVAIEETYNYLDNNCSDFVQDYGSIKNTNKCKITTNAYIDTEAINIGRALQNEIFLNKCNEGKHWCKEDGTLIDKDLIDREANSVVPIGIPTYAGYYGIVPCNGRDCYNNDLAKSMGIAINSDNTRLSYNGQFWSKADDSNLLVVDGGTYINKSVAGIIGISGNLVYYDNCQGGSKNWSNANSYCRSKGMSLSGLGYTLAYTVGGVPSCGGLTWTDTGSGTNFPNNYRDVWSGTSFTGKHENGTYSVRCVK